MRQGFVSRFGTVLKMAFFNASFQSASIFSVCFDVSNDSVFGLADEVQDVVYFFAHGNLFGNLDDGIFEAEVAGVDDSEGVGDEQADSDSDIKDDFVMGDRSE